MAKKRKKYDWKVIKEYYDKLIKMNEPKPNPKVCEKFGIPPNTLFDHIKTNGWQLSEEQNNAIVAFKEGVSKISETISKEKPKVQEELIEKKILEVLELSKISSSAIGVMQKTMFVTNKQLNAIIEEEEEVPVSDLGTYFRIGKEAHTVANPQPKTQINNNVQQNNTTQIALTHEQVRAEFEKDRKEILGR